MTAHELARLLLAGPDQPVYVTDDVTGAESLAAVWRDVPLDSVRRGIMLDTVGRYCPHCEDDHSEASTCPATRAEVAE